MTDRTNLKFCAMVRLAGTRSHLNLTLADFAERFGLSYAQGMAIEQQRNLASLATRTLIEAIRLDPDLIARAAVSAREIYERPIK